MCKYEIDPMSIVKDTERTRFCPQTDRRTDGQTDKVIPVYPPINFVESFIINQPTDIESVLTVVRLRQHKNIRPFLPCVLQKMSRTPNLTCFTQSKYHQNIENQQTVTKMQSVLKVVRIDMPNVKYCLQCVIPEMPGNDVIACWLAQTLPFKYKVTHFTYILRGGLLTSCQNDQYPTSCKSEQKILI